MKETLITYWIISVIFEAIHFFVNYQKLKEKINKYEGIRLFFDTIRENESFQVLKDKLRNPLLILAGLILFSIIAPILFPSSLVQSIKDLVGYKSKNDKKLEQIEKDYDEAEKDRKTTICYRTNLDKIIFEEKEIQNPHEPLE